MKRPLVCALLFLASGVLAGQYMAEPVGAALFVIMSLLVCGMLFVRFQRPWVFAFAVFAAAGYLLLRHSVAAADPGLEALAARGESLLAQGVVEEAGLTTRGDKLKLTVGLEACRDSEGVHRTGIRVLAFLPADEVVACGQPVVLSGKLEPLRRARNPGGFDAFLYYKARGIEYTMSPELVEARPVVYTPRVFVHNLRARLLAAFDAALPAREAGIMRSMIAGDKSALEDGLSQMYRATGIYHIICVSGLHISIIALCLDRLLRRWLSPRASAALTLSFALFYCLLTGAGVSAVRAATMFGVNAVGVILGRPRDTVTTVSFAAFCLLLYEPLYLWDVGFQYSFSAVYGLAVCAGPLERLLTPVFGGISLPWRLKERAVTSLSACLAATLATTPAVAYHFYYVQPYAVLANMLVLPTVAVTTVAGFIVGLLGVAGFGGAAMFAAGVPYALLKGYEWLCGVFVSLPFSVVLTGRPPMFAVVGWLALLALFVWAARLPRRRKLAGLGALCYVLALTANALWPEPLLVATLDVGQGDCIVIKKGSAVFVIDGGGSPMRGIGENTGVTVLKPYLDHEGVSRISAVFATHMDMDHVAGVIEILNEKAVGKLFISATAEEDSPLYTMLMETAQARGVPVAALQNGGTIQSRGFTFQCLHPAGGLKNPSSNDTSLVVKLRYGDASFLFTGDVEAAGEADMLAKEADLPADVLKLAHHGSKYSSTPAFLEAVAPKAVVVSASATNRYGHPDPGLMDYFAGIGVPVYNTADGGAVIMETDGEGIRLVKW